MKPRATIRDVAQAAGVSLATASRALNRAGRVSADTVAKVGRAARQLGYAPDAVAQSMRSGTSGVAGVLVSDISNPLYARIVKAIETQLQSAGLALLIANTHNDAAREKQLIELFRRRRVDGLVLGPCHHEAPELLASLAEELPVVALDRDMPVTVAGVHVDHFHGALQATRYLLNLGHTRIALLTPGSVLRPGRDRIAGFVDAYRERGLTPDPRLIRAEKSAMDYAFSEALGLLSMPEPPTAFLCLGTRILAGVLQALRHGGRTVPDDASVVSIGDTDLSQLFSPAITSLSWDMEAVGLAAAQLLQKQMDRSSPFEPHRVLLTAQLVLRESCSPYRAAALAGLQAPKSAPRTRGARTSATSRPRASKLSKP